MERLRALRGAITLEEDTRDQVLGRTSRLLGEMLSRNAIRAEDLVSIFFTATSDIHAEFPAAAAREMGLTRVPLLCARELDVESAIAVPMCVRILMHFYSAKDFSTLQPVYLEGAAPLRADLDEQGSA